MPNEYYVTISPFTILSEMRYEWQKAVADINASGSLGMEVADGSVAPGEESAVAEVEKAARASAPASLTWLEYSTRDRSDPRKGEWARARTPSSPTSFDPRCR